MRIGYQRPNARLAATVGAIAKSCAAAGITVQDAATRVHRPAGVAGQPDRRPAGQYRRRDGQRIERVVAVDAYALHTGNGNNLSGYSNERVDGIIGALAVTADPKELARLLGESAPVLWGDMPTLPLYRQQRTLLTSK